LGNLCLQTGPDPGRQKGIGALSRIFHFTGGVLKPWGKGSRRARTNAGKKPQVKDCRFWREKKQKGGKRISGTGEEDHLDVTTWGGQSDHPEKTVHLPRERVKNRIAHANFVPRLTPGIAKDKRKPLSKSVGKEVSGQAGTEGSPAW